MEEETNSLKRHRNESGQGDLGHQEKKPFAQNSTESSVPHSRRRSFSMSGSSMSTASVSSMGSSVGSFYFSAGENEAMVCDTSSDDVLYQPEQKSPNLDIFSLDIKRGQLLARYEIKISYAAGKWSSIKDEVRQCIFKYVRVAGNSLGGIVDVDLSAVRFVKDNHLTLLNQFYGTLEDLFLQWDILERPTREATVEKRLILNVPMFKHWKSENTNVIDSGEETHPQLNDQKCQQLLENCDGEYESRCQKFALFERRFDSTTIEYNFVVNSGSEATNLEFKLLKNGEGLTKRILKDSNKLLLYVSAFGIRDGGLVMYGIEDGSGRVKGQILSGNAEERHFFENIQKQVLHYVSIHTVCLNRQGQRCDPTELLEIKCIPVVNTSNESRPVRGNDYYAVIVIHIKPFDGIVFNGSGGPEAYRITKNLETVRLTPVRLTPEEWLTEKCRRITAKTITNGLSKLNFEFTSAVEETNVFELPNSVRSIREKMFRVSGQFTLYPEGFLQDRRFPVISQIQQSFQASCDEGIILAEICRGQAVYLFIISRQCGLHFFMIPVQRNQPINVLMDSLSTEAIELKKYLWEIGGCKLNLVIQTHLVLEDAFNTSKLHGLCPMQDNDMYKVLDSYIRVIGSFPNSTLKHQLGVEVLNVLTEKQFQVLSSRDSCRKLWVHGLPGSGKTVLAVMMVKYLVKQGETPVLFVAENQGLVSKLASHFEYEFGKEVQCISRTKFVGLNIDCFRDTRSIIMDEVHHYRVDYNVPNWYRRAVNIVKGKGRAGQWKNGFLWLFLDMFQKENTFESGIPDLNEQDPMMTLTEVIRCSCSIWAVVKKTLETVTINPEDNREFYKNILAEGSCPHDVEGQEVDICHSQNRPDNSHGLLFQVAVKVHTLLDQNWRPEDIGILFSKKEDSETFAKQYNGFKHSTGILLASCTEDAPNRIVCDSVRRFAGMDKPCIILVEPTVNERYFSANAFQALGMSRAMIKLIVIKKESSPRRRRRQTSQI